MPTVHQSPRAVAIISAYGPDPAAVREALAWVVTKAIEHGVSEAAVLVNTLSQVEGAADHLGVDPQRLRRDRAISTHGVRVRFINQRDSLQLRVSSAGVVAR